MALTEDFTKPDFANAIDGDLDQIRDNFHFLLLAAINGAIVIPGWTTTVNTTSSPLNYAEPDSIVLTKGTRAFHFNYTWTSGNVTQIVCQYNDGVSSPSLTTVTGGTITLTYDGSGNFTGATTA
jgi:hypothetical protein